MGLLFSAPYVIYVLGVLAFPLGYAVYISFHDYFFTAPRVKVDRPFVGLENYITVLIGSRRAAFLRQHRRSSWSSTSR